MNKKYLKDFNDDELKKLLEVNLALQAKISDNIYENNMDNQRTEYEGIFTEKAMRYFDVDEYYTTFSLRLLDVELINWVETDYLSKDALDAYNKAVEAKHKLDLLRSTGSETDTDEDNCFIIVDRFLKEVEKQLHDYEIYPDYTNDKELMEYELLFLVKECEMYNDFYIDASKLGQDEGYNAMEKVYHDVTTTNKF